LVGFWAEAMVLQFGEEARIEFEPHLAPGLFQDRFEEEKAVRCDRMAAYDAGRNGVPPSSRTCNR
jgi:hypothetical protein